MKKTESQHLRERAASLRQSADAAWAHGYKESATRQHQEASDLVDRAVWLEKQKQNQAPEKQEKTMDPKEREEREEREREEREADERRRLDEKKREIEEQRKAEEEKLRAQANIIAVHLVREMLPQVFELLARAPDNNGPQEFLRLAHKVAVEFVLFAAEKNVGMGCGNVIMLNPPQQQAMPVPPHLQKQLQDALSGSGALGGIPFGIVR